MEPDNQNDLVQRRRRPGGTLFLTFYTGYVMLNADATVSAMAGTYQEQEIAIGPVETTATRTAESEPAGGGTATTTRGNPAVHTTTVQGGWYATWLDAPLV